MEAMQLATTKVRAQLYALMDLVASERKEDGGDFAAETRADTISESKLAIAQLLETAKAADRDARCSGTAADRPAKKRRAQAQCAVNCSSSMLRCFAAATAMRVPGVSATAVATAAAESEDYSDADFQRDLAAAVGQAETYRATVMPTDTDRHQPAAVAAASIEILPAVASQGSGGEPAVSSSVVVFGYFDGFKCFLRLQPPSTAAGRAGGSSEKSMEVVAVNFVGNDEASRPWVASQHEVYREMSESARAAAEYYSASSTHPVRTYY